MDPYRQQAVRPPQIPIEIEADAIRHVAEHKQKVQGVFTAIGVIIGIIVAVPCWLYFDDHGDMWIVQALGPMYAAALAACVPIVTMALLWKSWLRKNRDAWIRAASVRFNIPAEALEWVTRDDE